MSANPINSQVDVVWSAHPTARSLIGLYLKVAAGAIAGCAALIVLSKAGVFPIWFAVLGTLAVLGGTGAVAHLTRTMTVYMITRKRVMMKEGVLNIRKEQATFEKINNVIVERSLIQRLLKIGTITIETANDGQGVDMKFKGVADPAGVESTLDHYRLFADDDDEAEQELLDRL